MARKIEKWTPQEIPNAEEWLKICDQISHREMVITSCAIIDTQLADLIAPALLDDPKEVEDFLGLDADGRAPLGSFGARIQAAYLLGLIDEFHLRALRLLKDVRNAMSHNVRVSFADPKIIARMDAIIEHTKRLRPPWMPPEEHLEYQKMDFGPRGDAGAAVGTFMGVSMGAMNYLAVLLSRAHEPQAEAVPKKTKKRKKSQKK